MSKRSKLGSVRSDVTLQRLTANRLLNDGGVSCALVEIFKHQERQIPALHDQPVYISTLGLRVMPRDTEDRRGDLIPSSRGARGGSGPGPSSSQYTRGRGRGRGGRGRGEPARGRGRGQNRGRASFSGGQQGAGGIRGSPSRSGRGGPDDDDDDDVAASLTAITVRP